MAAISVHQFAQCITCHAWSPDYSSKFYIHYSSITSFFFLFNFFFFLCLFPDKNTARIMDLVNFVAEEVLVLWSQCFDLSICFLGP
jgi:hypothetical protein